MEPFADEEHFAGDGGDVFPGEQAEQREIQLGEGVHARHAAEVERHFARLQHARVLDGHAGEFERQIGLDGGVDLRRAAVIDVPAAIGLLQGKDVVDGLALPLRVHLAVPMVVGDGVGDEGGIHHQFAHPVTFRLLPGQQKLLRPLDGGLHAGGKRIGRGLGGQNGRFHPGITLGQHPYIVFFYENPVKNFLSGAGCAIHDA